jgi:hypothetical protein
LSPNSAEDYKYQVEFSRRHLSPVVIIGLNVRAEARTLQYGKFQGRQFSGQILRLR